MYADSTPSNAGAHVSGFSQSNGGAPDREPIRTGTPRATSRSATRRPVLPVPPITNVVASLLLFCIPISNSLFVDARFNATGCRALAVSHLLCAGTYLREPGI